MEGKNRLCARPAAPNLRAAVLIHKAGADLYATADDGSTVVHLALHAHAMHHHHYHHHRRTSSKKVDSKRKEPEENEGATASVGGEEGEPESGDAQEKMVPTASSPEVVEAYFGLLRAHFGAALFGVTCACGSRQAVRAWIRREPHGHARPHPYSSRRIAWLHTLALPIGNLVFFRCAHTHTHTLPPNVLSFLRIC